MSRSFLFIGVVATVWVIGITLADKTPSQASSVKQRGDQILTSEDDLVAPSVESEIFTSKHTQIPPKNTKKNEVGVSKDKKGPTKLNYKIPVKKYSPSKKLTGNKKKKFGDRPRYFTKGKQIRPLRPGHLRQPYKANNKHYRPNFGKISNKNTDAALRRDSSYGAPAAAASYNPPAPLPKVIIKQAGPSKQYAWVGHQHYYNPGHNVPGHVFAAADLPKWSLMGNNIFQANLLYPGKPGGAPAKSQETYKSPPSPPAQKGPPPAAAPAYVAQEPAAPSYGPPAPAAPAYESPSPAAPAYSPPAPAAPAYSPPAPAAPVYSAAPAAPAPVYKSPPNPFVASTTPSPPPRYQPSANPASVYVGQPSYVPSYPSIQYVPSQPTAAAPTPASTTAASFPSSAPNSYSRPQPFTVFNNFNSYSALPQAPSHAPVLPAVARAPNVYNVPIKVEETPYQGQGSGDGGDEVFYIFYEDKKPAASYDTPQYHSPPTQNDISSYIVEDVQASPAPYPASPSANVGNVNQFSAPNQKDIHTIYVPFENAVNIPATYDVSVASSFGYDNGAPSQQAGTGAAPPSYSGFPNFPVTGASAAPPSYDSSISSYDAPILDDNSYTAKSPIRDVHETLWYGDATGIAQPEKHPSNRPVRNLRLLPAIPREPNYPSKSLRSHFPSASEDAKVINGKYSFKLLPGQRSVPYGTRLGPRKHYDIAVPGL